jgi:hypothetical protein
MNRVQQNRHSMHDAVVDFFDKNSDKIAQIVALATKADQIKTLHLAIKQTDEDREALTDGTAQVKDKARKELAHKTHEVCSLMLVFANDAGDLELAGAVGYNSTAISRFTDMEMETIPKVILNRLKASLPLLGNYGLTQADADDLQAKIDHYKLKKISPRNKKGDRKLLTGQLNGQFKTMTILLKQADKLMVKFKKSDADFYHRYKTARVVFNLRARSAATDPAQQAGTSSKMVSAASSELEKWGPAVPMEPLREVKTASPAPSHDNSDPNGSSVPQA